MLIFERVFDVFEICNLSESAFECPRESAGGSRKQSTEPAICRRPSAYYV